MVLAIPDQYRAIRLHEPREEAFALMRDIWVPNPTWAAFIAAMLAKYAVGGQRLVRDRRKQ